MHDIFLPETTITGLEVKMFYGASTINADDGMSAVGCLLKTARKYTRLHGDGAMLFLYGCGDALAEQLSQLGVLVLDGSAGYRENGLVLDRVEAHQRTWCAEQNGHILP